MSSGVTNTSVNDPTPRNVEPKNVGTTAPAPPAQGEAPDHKEIDESPAKTSGDAPAAAPKTSAEGGAPVSEATDEELAHRHAGKVGYG